MRDKKETLIGLGRDKSFFIILFHMCEVFFFFFWRFELLFFHYIL